MDLHVMGLLSLILVFMPQVFTYSLHLFFFRKSREKRVDIAISQGSPVSVRDVSFILPIRREPLEYLENALKYIHELGIPGYEVIVVSDDDEGDKDLVISKVMEMREKGVNAWVIWRSVPRGMRTGALNTGLFASRSTYIYVMDIDTRPEKCLFEKAMEVLESDSNVIGVVGRWEPINIDTRISEALGLAMKFVVTALYKGRSVMGLSVYPLGTGTLYRADLLKKLGGWDEKRVQDDMELGARVMKNGLMVKYIDECTVFVENPSTYKSLRIQQSRWAYGALDAAIARFKHIFGSSQSFLGKIEALTYLLQYLLASLVFTGNILLAITMLFTRMDYVRLYLVFPLTWLIATTLYGSALQKEFKAVTGSTWRSLVCMGRLSAVTLALSPYIAFSSFKALMRIKEIYKRTPKGLYQGIYSGLRVPWELLMGLFFTFTGIYGLINGLIFTGIWLLVEASGFIYVVYRFPRDVFYK
ncbi:MAG: glycosyltransferase family 2 protein [Desulfurococcaceae archaeon]